MNCDCVVDIDLERDHCHERNHAKPAPCNAARYLKGLHAEQDYGSDEKNEVEGNHACKRPTIAHVPEAIIT